MQSVLEKPVDDAPDLAEATVEAVTDFLKASAPPSPALAAPVPTVKAAKVTFTPLDASGKPCGPSVTSATTAALTVDQPGLAAEYLKNDGPPFSAKEQEALWKAFYHGAQPVVLTEGQVCAGSTADQVVTQVLTAATGWVKPSQPMVEPGTGEPDVEWLSGLRARDLVTDQEVVIFLDACAERLNRFGWVSGTLRVGEYLCSVGAISVRQAEAQSVMSTPRAVRLAERAVEILRAHLGLSSTESIEAWNDTPGRTKQEVVQAFRNAAQFLRDMAPIRQRGWVSFRTRHIFPGV